MFKAKYDIEGDHHSDPIQENLLSECKSAL